MEGIELLVVVVFFLVGYWAVDFFWPKKKGSSGRPAAAAMPGLPASDGDAPWHEVLGVASDATREQIRKAYEEKSAQYHADRITGMSPEFRESALRATRRINDAYEQAVRARS